ncbi:hypothetical protein GQX73_g3485 [Xylaria multiplex]|uniref:DNA repair metallo-beta-lactamase domain-containing protein n=1 Tax=Xylaria multiplex TaxID=323545 RepID=A0A7C8MS75_9PEZI|nr:hypothetical protein GQX73_g3485 [Xylaria multiplex]
MPTKSVTPRRQQPKQSKLSFKPVAQGSSATTPNGKKASINSNGNILNFFKKVEVEEQLFLPGSSTLVPAELESPTVPKEEDTVGAKDCIPEISYQDDQNPSKRRKLSHGVGETLRATEVAEYDEVTREATYTEKVPSEPVQRKPKKVIRGRGPFLADSDSEDDTADRALPNHASAIAIPEPSTCTEKPGVPMPLAPNLPLDGSCPDHLDGIDIGGVWPNDGQLDDLEDIDGLLGNDDDEFYEEGEEFRERLFMEEQARLEAQESGDHTAQACPVCNTSLDGITPEQATIHVNACLDDGTPFSTLARTTAPLGDTVDVPQMSKRFAKAAVPRPGQTNPISLGSNTNRTTSAFSKLMSSHAEDSAWASAAAAENASRGKPAYQRTYTTYLNPRYSFPPQDDVVRACADFCKSLSGDPRTADEAFNRLKNEKGSTTVSSFFPKDGDTTTITTKSKGYDTKAESNPKNRLLVICGTYSIGKERICKVIAQALNTKIFASASKIKICSQLGDPELTALMTSNPYEAQVHMQMLMEIRAETLQDYLDSYKPHFTRIVGFRPSGWNFRSPSTTAKNLPANASPGSVPTTSILHSELWRTRFGTRDFVAQRGSTREAMCFGVPYSEHSSFRELALFLMTLRIEKVVPTVNVGSEVSRKRMKAWTDRWLSERRKGGVVRVLEGSVEKDTDKEVKGIKDGRDREGTEKPTLWDGKDGKRGGGGVYW